MPCHRARHRPRCRLPDASGRSQHPADQARHDSRCILVGDRDHRHDRLRRCRTGDRARQADRNMHDLCGAGIDGVAGRHYCHRFRRTNSSPRLHRHLGHDFTRAAVCRTRRHGNFRCHGIIAGAGGRSRRSHLKSRRILPIQCISSPPARSILRSRARKSTCGSASVSSSAKWRCCAARAVQRLSPRSPAPTCWCSTRTISTR